jgi:hypothetical protein
LLRPRLRAGNKRFQIRNREMAVDVPASFIAQAKTPRR